MTNRKIPLRLRNNPPFHGYKEIAGELSGNRRCTGLTDQTYLAMNWVIGNGFDQTTVMALDMLADVLVNQESAPVRKALLEAGIGKDVYATTQNMLQNIFSIVVQNANAADKDNFRTIVMNTLQKVVAEKIDRETLKGSLNRMEFRLREGDDAQKGLTYNMRVMTGWMFTNNPFPSLEYEKQLSDVKASVNSTYLEELIRKDLVDNKYGLLLVLEPKTGLEKEIAQKTMEELTTLKKKMTPAELDSLVATTSKLVAYQQKEDSPEALASIPLLKLSDISREAFWYEASKSDIAGIPHLFHDEFTNDIVYMNYWYDLNVLSEDKIPYAALLTRLLGKMDAGNYDYEELDKSLNINTGGFGSGLSLYVANYDDNKLLPRFSINVKTTVEKLDTTLALVGTIINETKLENKDRLYELLKRHQSQLESSVLQNGYNVAATRLESYYSRRGVFGEKTRGIEYYWFVTGLVNRFNEDPDAVIAMLKETYAALFARNSMMAGITCSSVDYKTYSSRFEKFAPALAEKTVAINEWKLQPESKNEGILTASKVQYVLQGYDFRKLGIDWDGKWNVLNQVMSTDYLQTKIRVIGGAYGGFSSISKNGTINLSSYRDPNLKETLDNFKGISEYLAQFNADSTDMTRYIIGTIASMDSPLTPSEKGDQAFRNYFENVSREDVQSDREAVLSATADDLRKMSDEIARVLDQQVWCVYGNDEKINQNKTLFKDLVRLQQ